MSLEAISTACIARRERLSRDRRAILLAILAMAAAFTFIAALTFGGFHL